MFSISGLSNDTRLVSERVTGVVFKESSSVHEPKSCHYCIVFAHVYSQSCEGQGEFIQPKITQPTTFTVLIYTSSPQSPHPAPHTPSSKSTSDETSPN